MILLTDSWFFLVQVINSLFMILILLIKHFSCWNQKWICSVTLKVWFIIYYFFSCLPFTCWVHVLLWYVIFHLSFFSMLCSDLLSLVYYYIFSYWHCFCLKMDSNLIDLCKGYVLLLSFVLLLLSCFNSLFLIGIPFEFIFILLLTYYNENGYITLVISLSDFTVQYLFKFQSSSLHLCCLSRF